MLHDATHRAVRYFARSLAACVLLFAGAAWAQSGEPIKIGYGISQTGGLAPNGKSALLAQKIWEEDVNAKGGLLGRPVKLIYYDDQTNPATVPGIYTKLRLRHQHAGAGDAGRRAEEEDADRTVRARGQQ